MPWRSREMSVSSYGAGENKPTMYRGILDRCPKILVDQSTFVTLRRMRGRNQILHPRQAGSWRYIEQGFPMVGCVILSDGYFIVGSGRVVCPSLFCHHLPCDRLRGVNRCILKSTADNLPRSHANSELRRGEALRPHAVVEPFPRL